jgi:hypothetical protein
MQRLGDRRVTSFATGNVDYRRCGAVFMARNVDEIVDINGVMVRRPCFLSQPLMIKVAVGIVTTDHRHRGLARRRNNVNLIAKFSTFFLCLLPMTQQFEGPTDRPTKTTKLLN